MHVGDLLGDLGGRDTAPAAPAAELLAGLHRDLTAHLAAAGAVPSAAVGRPRSTEQPREAGPPERRRLRSPIGTRLPTPGFASAVAGTKRR